MNDSSKYYDRINDADAYSLLHNDRIKYIDDFSRISQREPGDIEELINKLNKEEKITRWHCLQEPEESDEDVSYDKTDSHCYLTSACMKYLREKFDDNCYELTVLRWFRDNFVSKNDIEHYYKVAPIIVAKINNEEKCNAIYDYIYDNIIDYCITEIENGNYKEAYKRYKESILALEAYYISQSDIKTISKKSLKLINSYV